MALAVSRQERITSYDKELKGPCIPPSIHCMAGRKRYQLLMSLCVMLFSPSASFPGVCAQSVFSSNGPGCDCRGRLISRCHGSGSRSRLYWWRRSGHAICADHPKGHSAAQLLRRPAGYLGWCATSLDAILHAAPETLGHGMCQPTCNRTIAKMRLLRSCPTFKSASVLMELRSICSATQT